MEFVKKVMGSLSKCYCLAPLHYNNEDFILVAAEKQDPCYLFNLKGEMVDTVWEGPGGVMTMVQVPGSNGQFLATHKFYSPNDSKEAKIIVCTPVDGQWKINTLVELPFVHRFDILESEGRKYLIACALKSGHEYKNDWTHPGKIFVAELPGTAQPTDVLAGPAELSGGTIALLGNLTEYSEEHQLELRVLKDGLTKNHGYTRCSGGCVISTDNGIFKVSPPSGGRDWQVEMLTSDPASDAVLVDLNGDGQDELCVLAPFHGPEIKIYEKKGAVYECVYKYDKPAEFTHAIYGGTFAGREVFIAGHREGAMELLMFTWDGGYKYEVIDSGRGPANVLALHREDGDVLVAANRETNEIAMYEVGE